MKLQSGHEAQKLDNEEADDQKSNWTGYTNGLVRLHPDRWLFPADFVKYADKLYNFEFKSSDVLVMTWPKCGTTWMQEIVWTMVNSPDLDHPLLGSPINNRVPFLDCDMFLGSSNLPPSDPEASIMKEFVRRCSGKDPADGVFLQLTKALPEPRTIKTHLPFSLLSPALLDKAKVVYVARHPKDVVVSYHHHSQLFKSMDFVGTFDKFVEYFLNDDLVHGPYWLHLKEAWEKRDHPNLHFIYYEDLKSNISSELQKLSDFLNADLSEEQLKKVTDYTSFNEMKQRDNVFKETSEDDVLTNVNYRQQHGGFFWKGEMGSWKSKLTLEQTQKVDDWIERHITPLGITFKQVI